LLDESNEAASNGALSAETIVSTMRTTTKRRVLLEPDMDTLILYGKITLFARARRTDFCCITILRSGGAMAAKDNEIVSDPVAGIFERKRSQEPQ
jgi:hypothetical protein